MPGRSWIIGTGVMNWFLSSRPRAQNTSEPLSQSLVSVAVSWPPLSDGYSGLRTPSETR